MADLHVDSTSAGTPTSPYDTWATAAATLGAAATAAAAGDTIWVHPSHSETAVATNVTMPGTPTNPVKIICGTPDTVSGITALQNTAIWGGTASTSINLYGSYYVHGIIFRMTGSSGSGTLRVGVSNLSVCSFNDCQFYWNQAGGSFGIGTNTVNGQSIVTLNNCKIRYASSTQSLRLNGRVYATNLEVMSGSTPTTLFNIADGSQVISSSVEIDGLDFSVLAANTSRLTSSFGELSQVRIRNLKTPTGWGVLGSTEPLAADILMGCQLEVLNYGDGDTNHRYWIENKQGRSMVESTIKPAAAPAGNSTATWSRRMQTLTSVAYPNAAYRGPPVSKYVVANGKYKGFFGNIVHDGSVQFTEADFWIEVSYRGTSGSSLATVANSRPSILETPVALYDAGGFTWNGATGTGPNGSTFWYGLYAYVGGLPIMEDGWVTITPCMSIPSKTLFFDENVNILDEGDIP